MGEFVGLAADSSILGGGVRGAAERRAAHAAPAARRGPEALRRPPKFVHERDSRRDLSVTNLFAKKPSTWK